MDLETTPLVNADWLSARAGADGLALIDIRTGPGAAAAFEAGHVPGSRHSDYAADGWRQKRGAAAGALPDAASLETLFGRLGLKPGDHAVIIPAGAAGSDFSAAARVYWTLKVAGHTRVSILDGGLAGWRAAGKPVAEGAAPAPTPSVHPVRLDETLRASLADVEAALDDPATILLDSRSRASFEGAEQSPQAARPGRLPGARHLDHTLAYDGGAQRLKPETALRQIYGSLPEGPLVSYCNTGHLAAANWFVLSEILGRPEVRLYDGSMSEWSADPDRPMATGPG